MKKEIHSLLVTAKRAIALVAVISLVSFSSPGLAMAAGTAVGGQVQTRSIRMSDNGASGGTITTGVGSGTNVTYRVTFKAATSYTIKGVVLDFCDGTVGTPFIGDATCDPPAGFDVSSATVDVTDFEGNTGLQTATPVAWDTSTTTAQTFAMTNTEGLALTSGNTYTFAITGVTNPSAVGTFYSRLITYISDTGAVTSYTHGDAGTYQDYGGFALSTASVVQVTAKVQEALTFCVSGPSAAGLLASTVVAPTDCSDSSAPAITLGHGTNKTLDATQVDRNSVWTYTSSNALNGVTIRMRNSNSCGGLSTDGGTTCDIPAIGTATPAAIVAGTANFGMFCLNSTGGTGAVTCDAGYHDPAQTNSDLSQADARWYGMDNTSVTEQVTALYGDTIAASTGPINNVLNEFEFAATASNTTPAGIYTGNLAMIATGSF